MVSTVLMLLGLWLLAATVLGLFLGRLMAAHEVFNVEVRDSVKLERPVHAA
jgi:hypothetical protein